MRKLAFGTLRRDKSPRVKWLDYHNLLGIVITGWLLLVGLTGVINALEKPIVSAWRAGALADLMAHKKPGGDPAGTGAITLARIVAGARAEVPEMRLQFIAFPGSDFAAVQDGGGIRALTGAPACKPPCQPLFCALWKQQPSPLIPTTSSNA